MVEARQDTTVVIHPLTDHRRVLPLEKKGELVAAHPDFQIVISYNPGYQSLMKDLKQSTKQRFGALDFNYPAPEIETEILAHDAPSLDGLFAEAARLPLEVVDIFAQGKEPLAVLQEYNKKMGLALDQGEMEYLVDVFTKAGRPPHDVELFMFAQVNSE